MRAEDTFRPDLHTFIDDSVRSNSNRRVQFRSGMYDSRWMDHNDKSELTIPNSKLKLTRQHGP
jgi:hypothetical protein